MDNKIVAEINKKFEKEKIIQQIENNKLEDHLNGDDFYEEIRLMTSEQLELFWGFHNPETSETFWGNVESALNLGK